jgi:histidinol-phosphate aminotransferase
MADKTVYLDRNENNYGPAPVCMKVLREATSADLLGYSKAYRRGVKSDLSERLASDFKIPEERVLLGYGAEDILKQLVQCYLTEGQKLLIPAYSWWYYKEIADEVRGVTIEYALVKGKDSFHYDIDHMIEIVKQEDPKLIFISSPNNPTGNSISQADLERLLEAFKDRIVALDEAYWYHSQSEHVIKLINRYKNLVVIRTFSKYFALAGMRIGYALTGENLTELKKLSNRYLGYNSLSEKVALAALDSSEYYYDIARKMNADKDLYYQELNRIAGFKVYRSDANFVLVEMPKEMMEPLKKHLTGQNLIIKFMNEPVLNSHLRITLGTQEENRRVIDEIKKFAGV